MDRAVGLSRSDLIKERNAPFGNHEVIFAVQPKNQEQLKDILDSVSDPRNVLYGRHWTREQVADLTSNPEGTATVLSFLAAAGATVVSESLYGEYITASAPIALWEDLFDTTFHVFTHIRLDGSRNKVVRAEKYSIPATLIPHVVAVFNTVQLPMKSRRPLISPLNKRENKILNKTESRAVPVIHHFTIPSILNAAYKIDSNVASTAATQGLYESLDQSFSPADLLKFQTKHSYPDQPVIRVIGGHSSDSACTSNPNDCAEANLDVQYMMAMSNSPTTYWYSDQNNFSDWLISVSNDPKPPLVLSICIYIYVFTYIYLYIYVYVDTYIYMYIYIYLFVQVLSISYGASENQMGSSELNAFNYEAMKLGLQVLEYTRYSISKHHQC
jgi:hypothetical protein